jgi:HD-like signal output (HDOD) protein
MGMESKAAADRAAMDDLIARVGSLHSAPQVAQQIIQLTGNIDFDPSEVVDCLKSDPSLALKILRVLNSSQYGFARKISNLRQAAALLGRRALRLVPLTFSLVETLTRGAGGRVFYDYWRRALTMANGAARLSEHDAAIDHDAAYSAGLVADLGILLLAQAEGETYISMYTKTLHGPALEDAERRAFGFSHAALGAHLLESWQFPRAVVEAAAFHHCRRSQAGPVEMAVHAGSLLADVLWGRRQVLAGEAWICFQAGFRLTNEEFRTLPLTCKKEVLLNAELFDTRLTGSALDSLTLLDQTRRQQLAAALETTPEPNPFLQDATAKKGRGKSRMVW